MKCCPTRKSAPATISMALPVWIPIMAQVREIPMAAALAVLGGAALVFIGAIATTVVRWFALAALVAFAVALFISYVFAPAAYFPLKQAEDKRLAKNASGYVGAEKQDQE